MLPPMSAHDLRFTEILGLEPLSQRWRETLLSLKGDRFTPPSRFGLSSLRILRPTLALRLWRGERPFGRQVPIYNLFNRTPTPEAAGWSVRKTHVRDFRGGRLTYDSHNGTDFATPPGTIVVAPAPARVVLVVSEFNRGGLKVMLDHGDGLVTTMAHLARALVREGDVVPRGAPVALSGASGLNFVASALTDPPHVHMNVWLDGLPVDPYAAPGEVALWRDPSGPSPHRGPIEAAEGAPPTEVDGERLARWIAACRDPELAARLRAEDVAEGPDRLRASAHRTIFYAAYYPTRFAARENPYATAHPRAPRLDLPFRAEDYDGVLFLRD